MPDASHPGSQSQLPLRERLLLFWERARKWMHVYLALDVRARRYTPVDIREVASPTLPAPRAKAGESLPSTKWRSIRERENRPLAMLAPGECVADTYEVLRLVAAGDLSTVYLVRHRHWNIDLALRVPRPELALIPGALRHFATRAEQWSEVGLHPNIASCYHVHSFSGVPLIVAEFVEGVTLRVWLATDLEDRLRQGLDVAIQVCHALEHAHARGIAHGACTSDKIVIARGHVPKLVDFGVPLSDVAQAHPAAIRVASSEQDVGDAYAIAALMQAAPYVAPERWQQPTVIAPSADVFALGVCLWEIFGGVHPYDSTGTETPSPLREIHLGDDQARATLANLLRRCVAWDVASRPSTVQAVRQELLAIYEMLFREVHVSRPVKSTAADRLNAFAVISVYGGRLAEAEQAWEAALERDPDHLDSLFNRALTHWRQGTITDEALAQQVEEILLPSTEKWKIRWLIGLIHFERGDLEAAETSLEQALGEHRGEVEVTQALERVQRRSRNTERSALLSEQRGFVSAVGLSAEGKIALAAADNGTATVWDLATGECLQVLTGHDGGVTTAVLSADGRAALTGGDDGTIRVWDVATGVCERVFAGGYGRIASLSVSSDGGLLLWASYRSSEQIEGLTMQVWDTRTGACVRVFEGHTAAIKSVFLSADGRSAVSGGDDRLIRLWNVKTGQCTKTFAGHEHFVSAVCMSSDGAVILSASWDMTLRLWDCHTGRCLRVFAGHRALVATACLSADGVWAASGGWDGTVRLWEVATGRCLCTLHAPGGLVTAVALTAIGDRIVSGGSDGTIRRWDTPPELREPCRLRTAAT